MAQNLLQPGGNLNLVNGDDGKLAVMDGSALRTVQGPPPPAPFGLGVGWFIDIRVVGANAATFTPQGAGAAVEGAGSLSIPGDTAVRLIHLGGNAWRTSLKG